MVPAKRFLRPKFNLLRYHSKSRPKRGPWNTTNCEANDRFCHFTLKLEIISHRIRLFRGPGADLAQSWSGCEIRISLFFAHRVRVTTDAYLFIDCAPIKTE